MSISLVCYAQRIKFGDTKNLKINDFPEEILVTIEMHTISAYMYLAGQHLKRMLLMN